MLSPLEAIDGDYRHALFTTYSVSLPFFEHWVLPILGRCGVRNVAVLADREQLASALEDPDIRRAGTAYHVTPVSVGPGAFHTKIILLVDEASARLVVSSANLTVSGQLRNLEIATVLDWSREEHRTAIVDAARFFNRLADDLPAHVIEAVAAATSVIEDLNDTELSVDGPRFVHNLDVALLHSLPTGDLNVVTPYVDHDGRTATRLSADRQLSVWVDGERLEAAPRFFEGPFAVIPKKFPRSLHGKAYWTASEVLAGSPNLAEAALLRTADAGNCETAIHARIDADSSIEPPAESWEGNLQVDAVARQATTQSTERDHPTPGVFLAWEDDDGIVVELPDGAVIERQGDIGWIRFGAVVNQRLVPDGELAYIPRMLRTVAEDGRTKYAIVHRVTELRIRRLRRPSSRATESITQLPLDLEGVKALEGVLSELYTLTELINDDGSPATPTVMAATPESGDASLGDWRPAHPGDEPRIPTLYRSTWKGEPDALLALVRQALRIDSDTLRIANVTDFDLNAELIDLNNDDSDDQDAEETAPPPTTTEAVLKRYRNAFTKLLDRGLTAITKAATEDLRDLIFQVLMQQTERLDVTVSVKEPDDTTREERLVTDTALRKFRLQALIRYLNSSDSPYPACLHTARYHLADCLSAHAHWNEREWEQLENLALNHAADLLATEPDQAPPLLDLHSESVTAWLTPYADRSDWSVLKASLNDSLNDANLTTDPFPVITGSAPIDPHKNSAAWYVLGQAAYLGLSDEHPYAVIVDNTDPSSPWDRHALIVVPSQDRLYEAMRNRQRGTWLIRYYQPVSRDNLERAGHLGPMALGEAHRQTIPRLPTDISDVIASTDLIPR